MDAAKTQLLKKTALLLTIALLLAAPFAAQAQTAFTYSPSSSITLNGTQYGCTTVNANTGTITYSAAQAAAQSGVDPHLTFSPGNSGLTTGNQLCFADLDSSPNITPGSHTIQINLTSTTPGGITGAITVTVNPNGTGGSGSGTGSTGSGLTLNYSGSSINIPSNSGVTGTGSFTLSNSTGQTISYSFSSPVYDNTSSGWLSFLSGTTGSVGAGQQNQVVVAGNPSGVTNGTHTATFNITYNGGGSGSINNIPVSFVVNGNSTGGNGTLTANPNPVAWSYNSSSSLPLQSQIFNTTVNVATTAGASSYSFVVQPTTGGQYLVFGNSQIQGGGLSFGNTLTLSPTSNIQGLPTGNYQELINLTDNLGNTGVLTVNVAVNGSNGQNGITLSPSPLQLNSSVGQTAQVQGTVTLTSTTTGTVLLQLNGTTGLTFVNNSTQQSINVTAGQGFSFIVYGNPTGLVANNYTGTLTATEGSISGQEQVTFAIGQSSSGGGNLTSVAPTSLQFNYQQGQPATGASSSLVPQNISVPFSGSYTTAVTSGNSWLSVVPTSGSGPGLITVSAVNVSGMAVGNYTGTFTVTPLNGAAQTVNVNLLVTTSAVVFANPPVLNISYTAGSSNPVTSIQVLASDSSAISVSASSSQSWLTVTALGSTTPAAFALTIAASSLPNGVNVANITISSNGANSQLTVPVVVTVTGNNGSTGGLLTLGASSLNFSSQVNGSAPSSQTLSVTASSATPYTASTTISNGNTNWLSISPSGSLNTASTSSLTVTVNPTGLGAATYQGSINLVTSSGTQTVPVSLVVGSSGGGTGGNITLSPTSLPSFNYTSGGTVPSAQSFNVLAANGNGSSISYSVTTSTQSGGGWLSATPTSGVTGQPVSVSLVSSVISGLAAGTYSGTVTVSPSGGTAVSMPITLVVTGLPTVSASPGTLTLSYQAGSSNTPTGTIQVSGTQSNLSYTVNASSSGWLQVAPTIGNTTTNPTIQVTTNPAGLSAGSYTGTIVVAGTNGAIGSSTTTVTLTVTAPLPTISAVVSAASGSSGPVSPGEIVSIFGPASNPIGPSTPATLTLDANGNVATTLGGVQVLFNGIPAPLTYVSATQINAVVPYGIAGQFAPYAQVRYLNQSSNAFSLNTAATAPGIFTQNGTGTGPGAILNQDNSINGSASGTKPAVKGNIIVIYMTGEGATSPTGITGKVTCSNCAISQLPVPLLPVSVTFIDSNNVRYPANFIFAGEAPGFVSGVMQIDVTVPTNVPSGTLQVVVSVGPNSSQAGVTVAVQ